MRYLLFYYNIHALAIYYPNPWVQINTVGTNNLASLYFLSLFMKLIYNYNYYFCTKMGILIYKANYYKLTNVERRIDLDNSKKIIKYYNELDRSYFMDEYKNLSHLDTPFPIGYGQTISQPSLVLKMTILLDVDKDSKVLEIGTGSGYQTALLAKASKIVYTVERIEELYLGAREKLTQAGYTNINFKFGDGSLGWEENAPYDRIMVTASASKLPDRLLDQLAPNGKMVIPVGTDLLLITKDIDGKIKKETVIKVRFVDLIGDY